jgi:DNA-binding response OmpR family regulator
MIPAAPPTLTQARQAGRPRGRQGYEGADGADGPYGANGAYGARRILIVDDEPNIRSFVGRALAAAGYLTDFAANGNEALAQALEGGYDLIILDLVMPDMNGKNVLDQLMRARPDQVVMVLSCVADVATKVGCLERGAQDYLTKPFSLAELLARVRVRIRADARPGPGAVAGTRAGVISGPGAGVVAGPGAGAGPGEAAGAGEVVRAGSLTLDVARLVADIGHGPVPLTRLEFLLLRELAEHRGESVAKGRLLASVWGYDFDPGSNVVDVCVRRLRSKLGFGLIKTVRGEGYQLADQ